MVNTSLKEYYIQLHKLSQDNTKIMNAISESFKSYTPEVTLTLDDDSNTVIHIPSFLYLENKLEELETSFNYLFNLPKSGEAWFTKDSDMYKMNIVHSNILPTTPTITLDNSTFNISNNNFLNDLIFPKTSLRLNLNNIPNNIHEIYVKKITLHNDALINDVFNSNLTSYNDYIEKLYLMNKDIDYSEYDFRLDLPLYDINYNSKFDILYIDPNIDYSAENIQYSIRVNTLYYSNTYDSSI